MKTYWDSETLWKLVAHEKLHLKGQKEILYDGVYYDVSNFIEKHPGGNVIEVFVDSREDATLHIQQFHHRSIKKVLALMKALPQKKANDQDMKLLGLDLEKQKKYESLTKDFLDLFETLKNEGLFDPNPFHVFCRTFEVLFLCGFGLYLLQMQPLPLLTRIVGILSLGLGMGRAGWVMHEGGHNSLLGIPKWDRLLSFFFFGIIHGFSKSYWNFDHNRHHATPQHTKYDINLDSYPALAVCKERISKPGFDIFGIMLYQKWTFIPIFTLLTSFGWKFLRHPYYCFTHGHYYDVILMVLHYLIFVGYAGLLNYFFAVYFFSINFVVSAYLSHAHLPVTKEPTHWVEYALIHSANVRSSWWVDYWMGNLNYQIEHHLFPTMPQYKNKLCCNRVKALAKKHNLPYNLFSYREALIKLLNHLGNMAKEI